MTAELGIAAALVHALGFCLYGRRMIAGDVEPNGVSWLMRGYGTVVLFVIWSGVGVPPAIMFHSAVSGVAALCIAVYALTCGAFLRPRRQDYVLLTTDVVLLAAYLALFNMQLHASMAAAVLTITAVRKVAPYWPILRTTIERPSRERPAAWSVWAVGYALLWLVAVEAGLPLVVQAYAAAMVGIHAVLAWLTFDREGSARRAVSVAAVPLTPRVPGPHSNHGRARRVAPGPAKHHAAMSMARVFEPDLGEPRAMSCRSLAVPDHSGKLTVKYGAAGCSPVGTRAGTALASGSSDCRQVASTGSRGLRRNDSGANCLSACAGGRGPA